jgi:hypothetical protein
MLQNKGYCRIPPRNAFRGRYRVLDDAVTPWKRLVALAPIKCALVFHINRTRDTVAYAERRSPRRASKQSLIFSAQLLIVGFLASEGSLTIRCPQRLSIGGRRELCFDIQVLVTNNATKGL